jgi:multimeric flavodoxin WrbA
MKVVAFNGSPRKDGNTALLIGHLFEALEKEGIETELVQLGGKPVHGCLACYKCVENKDGKCVIDKDVINDCIGKMTGADGIILGTPTYVTDVTTEIKALIDRATVVDRANGNKLSRKVGAAVVAMRRAGAVHAFDTINHFFGVLQMVIPGSIYWNLGLGRDIGDVENDEEGLQTMKSLGENMAWLLSKIHSKT